MEMKGLAVLLVVMATSIDTSLAQSSTRITNEGTRITTECNRQMDLVFMIDASNSVQYGNFRAQTDTIKEVTQTMDIRPGALRVGVVVFSTLVASFPLTDSKAEILRAMDEMNYLDMGTYTHSGLERAMSLFNKSPRPADVPKLLMVITDGSSINQSATLEAASRAKAQGITIYALGISNDINRQELEGMATSPDRVMYTPNFDNIKSVLEQAIKRACTLVVIPPPKVRTPAPTFPPTLPPVVTNHLCANSGSMSGGYGLVAHPAECDKYVQCYYNPNTGLHIGVVRHCGLGLHWNRQTNVCDSPAAARCPFDPCKYDCAPYHMTDSSRAYWTCENKVSVAKCCGEFESFERGKGCVKNMMCMEDCAIGQCKGVCKKQPVWNMPTMFQYQMSGGYRGWMSKQCAYDEFDLVSCDCTASSDHMCFPDFQSNLNSASSLGQYVRSNNAQLNNAGANLGQGANLHLDFHKGRGGEPITFRFSYRESGFLGDDSMILAASSHDCPRTNGNLLISYNNKYVMAHMWAKNGAVSSLSLPTDGFNSNDIKELTFTYHGKYMAMSVKVGQVEFVERTLAPRYVNLACGLDIGATTRHTGFIGLIQKISVYSCSLNRLY